MPARHHSPAVARAVETVIRKVRPQRVLVEGPSDANTFIPYLCAPETVAPIALLAYRQPDLKGATASANLTPQFVFYPFCDYSPELVAIRTAHALDIPVEFCDIPAKAQIVPDSESEEGAESTVPTDEPRRSVWDLVAQRMGYRNHDEWWEAVFESGVLEVPILLQRLQEWGELVIQEGGISERDALRNAYMWAWVERTIKSGVPAEAIVLVAGAAHTAAFAQPDFKAKYDTKHPLLKAPEVQFVLIPYSFPRLSSQAGYGAGNHAPQFYQDLWQYGSLEMATCSAITRMVSQMKLQGDICSHADAIEAFRLCYELAHLRRKPHPGYEEVVDACVALFGRGSRSKVEAPLKRVLIGERVGAIPPMVQFLPLQTEFYLLANQLGLPIKDDPTELRLNLAQPHDVQVSIFLHRATLAQIPYADLQKSERNTAGLGSTEGSFLQAGSLYEKWRIQWTPLVDMALTTAQIYGNSLREVARSLIQPHLQRRDDLAQLSRYALSTVLCELPELYEEVLDALESASAQDSDFDHLASATFQIASLIEYGASRSVRQEMFEPLLQRLYARACLNLPLSADCGDEDARTLGKGMRLLDNLAQRSTLLDETLWNETLSETTFSDRSHPYLQGVGVGLMLSRALSDEQNGQLLTWAERALSPGKSASESAHFIEGLLNTCASVAVRSRPLTQWFHEFITRLPADTFIESLPSLRRAFGSLGRNEVAYLIATLKTLIFGELAPASIDLGSYPPIDPEAVQEILSDLEWLCTLSSTS